MNICADWVAAIATCVSAIAVVVALCFIWIQTRNLRRSIQSSTYQNVYQTMIDVDRFFAENPNLKPYFYGGKQVDTKEQVNRERLFSIAEMLADYFDNVYHQEACMPPQTFAGFSKFMRDTYQNSPVLREFLSERKDWYSKKFIEHLQGISKTQPNSGAFR